MSFLLSEGHPEAMDYTLAHLWSEVRLAKRRVSSRMEMETLLFQAAAISVMDGKEGTKQLKTLFKRLKRDD